MDKHLPASRLAQELLLLLAQGDMTLCALARSLRVDTAWLHDVVSGKIARLSLPTVIGICRQLSVMTEDVWEPGQAAEAFRDYPAGTFDAEET